MGDPNDRVLGGADAPRVASASHVLRSVRRVALIEVVVLRGAGLESDAYREVTMFFDDEGRCVAEHDPVFPTPWYGPVQACREARP